MIFPGRERETKACIKAIERMMMSGDERETDGSDEDEDELLRGLEDEWRNMTTTLFPRLKKGK